jgi:hypothetical protein
MKPRTLFFDILVGVPGGCLIFMGMLLLNTILGMLTSTGSWTMLVLLSITSLVVGLMARLIRPYHGIGTALASGHIAAIIILYLRLATKTGAIGLVFGPAGMLVTVSFCTLGAWILPFLQKRTK